MNKIKLNNLDLKTFTEQDAEDYCSINNLNYNNIIQLSLSFNKLTDISGIKLFKNIKELYLHCNELTDIFDLKDLINLKELYLWGNQIKDISVLKDLKKLEILYINDNQIQNISVIKYFKKLEILNINFLELESDQIQYIQVLKNLYCRNGFKDMSVLKQLNKNIKTY